MGGKRERTGVVAVSDTSIQISFTYQGIHCRERIRLQPTPANLKRAEQHRAAILHAIVTGTFDYATTFPDSPRRFKFAATKGVMHTLIPAIGRIHLDELRRSDVRELCNKLPDATNKRLANIQSVLRASLADALDDDLIDANPLYGWTFKRKEAPKPTDTIDPFSADEQAAILEAATHWPALENLFRFALWTGLRTNELVALRWGDIDWLRGQVRISRGRTAVAEAAEEPKTRRSTRDVKLLAPALRALEAQKALTFLADKEIFLNPHTGQPWSGDHTIRTAWTSILKRAGVRYRRPYQTRHTYASMMLTAGESPIWIAAQMGHADTAMIYRNYGRWIPDAAPQAGDKAVALFGDMTDGSCDKAAIGS